MAASTGGESHQGEQAESGRSGLGDYLQIHSRADSDHIGLQSFVTVNGEIDGRRNRNAPLNPVEEEEAVQRLRCTRISPIRNYGWPLAPTYRRTHP